MTWGETSRIQAKGKRQRDEKVAVSPSRPMISSYAKSNVKLRHSVVAACDYTNDLPDTNSPT
ncbi:MAG: hypothetical protein ACR2N3_03635, partial [Pyrinomonadaceae bacterium]